MARIVRRCLIIENGFGGVVSAPSFPAAKPRAHTCRNHFLIGGGTAGDEVDRAVRLIVASSIDYWKIASDEFLLWD